MEKVSLDIESRLVCSFWAWISSANSLWWLIFCFNIVIENPILTSGWLIQAVVGKRSIDFLSAVRTPNEELCYNSLHDQFFWQNIMTYWNQLLGQVRSRRDNGLDAPDPWFSEHEYHQLRSRAFLIEGHLQLMDDLLWIR